jgi:putative tryptophan/tyrosine transport system substrate-binding protein
MKRRDALSLLGGAVVAWPVRVRAQQRAMPVIGLLSSTSPYTYAHVIAAFHKGMNEAGFFEGQNVLVEYRWAEGHYERLPKLATELVGRHLDVIVTLGGTVSALAAAGATTTIPVVFTIGGDPVRLGLVASFARPGGNVTGVSVLSTAVVAKRLELLHELLPTTGTVAMLVNPHDPNAQSDITEVHAAAQTLRKHIHILNVTDEPELVSAFATVTELGAGALLVGGDPFLTSRRDQIVMLAARHSLPSVYQWREFVMAGGLMSYGTLITEAYRQAGIYTSRILQGTKPMDLPVQQMTKIELVINMKTANALGLTFPITLLGRADEVIE